MTADDLNQITNLVHGYARRLDAGEFDAVGEMFAAATVRIQGQESAIVKDAATVAEMFRSFVRTYGGVPRTRHQMANVMIDMEGPERATGWCSVVVFQQTAGLALQPILTGDYHDRFEKVDGRWRFSERRIANDLFGDLSAHGKWDYAPPSIPEEDAA